MTDKRFTCEVTDTDLYHIETITDNFEMNTFDDVETVTELLNKFSEENKKLKEEISIINELLNEYYTADTSETLTHKLKCLLTELKYFRKASNTVEWQSYKEKEFEEL